MKRRFALALFLALALAPGTFVRTKVADAPPVDIQLERLSGRTPIEREGWSLEGIWQYSADHLWFGGFSALLALDSGGFVAFSDRGKRWTFTAPDVAQRADGGNPVPAYRVTPQQVEPRYANELLDIESAVRDPSSGKYWLGFEAKHAIHRFTADDNPDGLRVIQKDVDWTINSGAEAMVRLSDGRFLVIPEKGGEALLYPADPILKDKPARLAYRSPEAGFAITDARQMPDGRLILLLRSLAWGIPPFEGRIAIASLPGHGEPQELAPQIALDLTQHVPRENYEGMAVRERADGTLDLWLISDDNLSIMQRTLLVKLRLDPAKLYPARPVRRSQQPS